MDQTKYQPIKSADPEGEVAVAVAIATQEDALSTPSRQMYPCERRTALPAQHNNDSIFVPTAGNALQAIPKEMIEKSNLLSVTVPWGCRPGSEILVLHPTNGNLIAATVPPACYPGQSFFVTTPEEKLYPTVTVEGVPANENSQISDGAAVVVSGSDVEADGKTEPCTHQIQ